MKHLLSLLSFILLISNNSKSQVQAPFGLNDPTFNPYDIGNYVGDQFDFQTIADLVELSDGSVITGGIFQSYQHLPVSNVVKLNPDGTLNTAFSNNIFGVNSYVTVVAVQNDGKILVGGNFTSFEGSVSKRLVRLNPNGTLDSTFQSGIGFNGIVRSIKIQNDGKIYCGGEFSVYNNQPATHGIIRLNPDGTKDNTFSNNFACSGGAIREFEIQTDGKIVGVGNMTTYYANGNTRGIIRINPNGSLDSIFHWNAGTGLAGGDEGKRVAIDDLGRILLAGSFTTFSGSGTYSNLIRLNPDGTIDTQFQCFGLINVNDVAFHAPTKNLFVSANYSLVKLDSTGVSIPNWDVLFPGSLTNTGTHLNLYLGTDHFIAYGVLFRFAEERRFLLGKWSVDGLLDENFSRGYGANNGNIGHVEIDSQDRILISGGFFSFNNVRGRGFMRLNPNGSPDTSFYLEEYYVTDFLVLNDTNYLVYGLFTVNGYSTTRLVKLTSNGSFDVGFNAAENGPNDRVRSAAVHPDGKIILVGDFEAYNGSYRKHIVRIHPNGATDNSFSVGSGFNNVPLNVVIQNDGKYIVSGSFTSYNGVSCPEIVRLNTDGTRDFSFNPGPPPLTNYSFNNKVCVQPDNKLLVSGSFTQFLGVPVNSIIRLNEDGSVDTTFNHPIHGVGIKHCQIKDSSIYIAGHFAIDEYDIVGSFSKLNMDGSIDNQFVNHVADSTILSFDFQSDGKIIIAGEFGSYDNLGKNRIARLFPCAPFWSEDQITSCDSITWVDMNTYSNDTSAVYFSFPNSNGCDSVVMLHLTILESTTSSEIQTSCDSFTWPLNGQTYTTSGQYLDTVSNAAGCDSIITLNLTILNSSTVTDTYTVCDSLTWIDGNTYTSSTNTPDFILQNAAGCDSIITLDLTIIPSLPLAVESSFSMPSDANSCIGQVAVTLSGNADFELDFDNGSQVITSSGYSLVSGLCAGTHDLQVTDNCGDTLSTTIVIPVDSNYVFNNPFIDSLAQDSLGVTMTNCDIYYNSIDTAYIDSIWANGNTVHVIWNIVDSNGSNFDTASYVLNNGNGVYWLQLSVFCPFKALGEYFAVTEAIYFNNGSVSTAGLADHQEALFEIYPNPANNNVHLSFSGSDAELTVYDVQGKVVLKDRIQDQGTVSLADFERGVYLFDFNNSNGHSVQRVVKQ